MHCGELEAQRLSHEGAVAAQMGIAMRAHEADLLALTVALVLMNHSAVPSCDY